MSTTGDRSRAEFEVWVSAPPYEMSLERQTANGTWPGQYREYGVQLAWEAWQQATSQCAAVTPR